MSDSGTVSVRQELYAAVEKMVDERPDGYRDVSEFAREAIRLHLERVVKPNLESVILNRIKGAVCRRRFKALFQGD